MTTAALDSDCTLQFGVHITFAVVPCTFVPTSLSRSCSSVVNGRTCPGASCPLALRNGVPQLGKGRDIHDVRVSELPCRSKQGCLQEECLHGK